LAAEFGTPAFIFCEQTFRARAQEFRLACPSSKIYYAAKAFLSRSICKLAQEEGLCLDVASSGELHCALQAGFPAERIILHGNNKQQADVETAVEAGIDMIAIDNLEDPACINAAAVKAGRVQKVVVRVTPGVEAHTHEYIQTGQEDSKFGLSIQGGLAEAAIRLAGDQERLELIGVHAHIGSNVFSYDPFGKTIEILFQLAAELKAKLGIELQELNLGGGYGIAYVTGDDPVRLSDLSDLVDEAVVRESSRHGLGVPAISFEPGRYLIGPAMVTLYRVGAIKSIPGVRTYVSVDGGMADNIRPALYQAKYSALLANKVGEEPEEVVTLAGMHCESGDILVKDAALPASISRGDIVVVPATGAYGYSMASNYNRQPRPPVIAVKDGKANVMIRRETHDDLMGLEQG
ncbi:MAG: diaminopimelate decarboxylase, partial [Actinomycetota bacterium]